MAVDLKYGNVTLEHDSSLSLSDEPCFVIRAQDVTARSAILAWIDASEHLGASKETIMSAYEARQAIIDWQHAHPELVKVPD